jgi:acetyl esterase/lipase
VRPPRIPVLLATPAILVIVLSTACSSTNVSPNLGTAQGSVRQDVTYCNSETLDFYAPSTVVTRPVPLAIFVHGGGMTGGDKGDINSMYPFLKNALSVAGYAIASVNYRLAPQSKFPAQIEDVKCAIRYLRANAPKYGVNGSEIFAFGTSVGGQLVALAALTGSHSAFDVGAYMDEPSDVTAVVDMFGPANLTEAASGMSSSDDQEVFGNDKRSTLVLASPTHYVAANAPPILIVQGVNDPTVLESQSMELYNGLKAAGDQTQLVLVHNMGHMFAQVGSNPLDPSLGEVGSDMVDFFNSIVSGG